MPFEFYIDVVSVFFTQEESIGGCSEGSFSEDQTPREELLLAIRCNPRPLTEDCGECSAFLSQYG